MTEEQITTLIDGGVDYQDGLKRFSGYDMIYEKYLRKFLEQTEFPELCDAMAKDDYEEAFKLGHSIKGVTGNLSMAGLYNKLMPFVEMLRNETDIEGAKTSLPDLKAEYEKLMAALNTCFK